MAGRRVEEVVTECGCIMIPLIVAGITRQAHCPAHGWQKIDHKATVQEITGVTFHAQEFPANPPF